VVLAVEEEARLLGGDDNKLGEVYNALKDEAGPLLGVNGVPEG
jgi:hypothetical protein